MSESVLNMFAQQYIDMILCKSRYDVGDIQWFTEGPFWRRTSMKFSREYRILPDYEIGDLKHGLTLENIVDRSETLLRELKDYEEILSALRKAENRISNLPHEKPLVSVKDAFRRKELV